MSEWLLFDLDGTLIDHQFAVAQATRATLRDIIRITAPLRSSHLDYWQALFEEGRERLREFVHEFSEEELGDLLAKYKAEYLRNCRVFPEVPEALFRLRQRHRFAIICSGDISFQQARLRQLGIHSLADRVQIFSSEQEQLLGGGSILAALEEMEISTNHVRLISSNLTLVQTAAQTGINVTFLNRELRRTPRGLPMIQKLDDPILMLPDPVFC